MSALSDRPRHIDTDTIAHAERVSADDTLTQSECRPDVRLPDAVRCLKTAHDHHGGADDFDFEFFEP